MNNWVTSSCNETNWADNRLAKWNRVITVDDPYTQPANTSWKETFTHNYIYCFGLMITVDRETRKCPPFVFKLNNTVSWNTTDTAYIAR